MTNRTQILKALLTDYRSQYEHQSPGLDLPGAPIHLVLNSGVRLSGFISRDRGHGSEILWLVQGDGGKRVTALVDEIAVLAEHPISVES